MNPRVTVIIPVYNGQKFLRHALDSILNQSYGQFKCIVIDDGSTDDTSSIIQQYVRNDRRIHTITNDTNCGQPISRNKAVAITDTPYIALLDVDDVALPERLEKQITFLQHNDEIGVVASYVDIIDDDGHIVAHDHGVTEHEDIVDALTSTGPPFAHPSVCLRTDLIKKADGYRVQFPLAQDYDLWLRLMDHTRFAVLPEVLLHYRSGKHQTVPRRMHQGCLHVLAFASWFLRDRGLEDPLAGLSGPIEYDTASRLVPELLEAVGPRAWLVWIDVLINSPGRPDGSAELAGAWRALARDAEYLPGQGMRDNIAAMAATLGSSLTFSRLLRDSLEESRRTRHWLDDAKRWARGLLAANTQQEKRLEAYMRQLSDKETLEQQKETLEKQLDAAARELSEWRRHGVKNRLTKYYRAMRDRGIRLFSR